MLFVSSGYSPFPVTCDGTTAVLRDLPVLCCLGELRYLGDYDLDAHLQGGPYQRFLCQLIPYIYLCGSELV